MTDISSQEPTVADYRSLGLVGNPLRLPNVGSLPGGIGLDVTAHANRLVAAIIGSLESDRPKPVLVLKDPKIPSSYPLRTISMVEKVIGGDDSLNTLHAYVQLYMLRSGRIRATLRIVGERLAFRQFDETLAVYIEQVLREPDTSLTAYQVAGPDALGEFAERFSQSPLEVVHALFGAPEIERKPEFAEVGDVRTSDLEPDVDEDDDSPEIDETIGDAPGTGMAEVDQDDSVDESDLLLVDYLVEYAKAHYSPVIARALRVYRERGLAAMPTDIRVTKAPRKTLAAIAKFARLRFDRLVIFYDGFENWHTVPPEMRGQVAASLTEIRWLLAEDAVIIPVLERGEVNEIEEPFSGGTRVDWDFAGVRALERDTDRLDVEIVEGWLVDAAAPGSNALTLSDPVLAALSDEAGGSLTAFATAGAAAIDDAALRGVKVLDDAALAAGRAARAVEEA